MARLMEHVRLPLLPREYLVQVRAHAEHMSAWSTVSLGWRHVDQYEVMRATKHRSMGCRTEGGRRTYSPWQLLSLSPLPILRNLLPPLSDLGR